MNRFYITTPIYYVNDAPHLGHAYATIAVDAMARFHRAMGHDSYFLTGTDEHGQKIEQAASKKGKTPRELADEVVLRYQATWKNLGISHDDFIRTTEERHKRVVAEMWKRMEARGDIYLGSYEGHYCVGCEGFYPESQLLEGKRCPTHQTEVQWVSEPSFFFRMSRYQDALLRHIDEHPEFVRPENYRNEVVAFVKSGLRDLSVSRTTFKWGIPVPGHEDHVIYVWLDALTNYVSALGDIGSERYQRFWPAAHHLIGKDILRFHAVYWPCMLLSADLPLPRTVFATGWWTLQGAKISKSMPATYVEPNQLAADISADALRYFLLREVPLGLDGDFSYEALIGRYNADLANDLGNLLNRTLTMAGKFCDGNVPPSSPELAGAGAHGELMRVARQSIEESARCFADFAPSRALESIWTLVREANRYIDTCQPWKLARDFARRAELDHAMRLALEALLCAARMVWPVMPQKAAALVAQLGVEGERTRALLGTWPGVEQFGSELERGTPVRQAEVLFPRIDKDREAVLLDRWMPAQVKAAQAGDAQAAGGVAPGAAKQQATERVSFAEFSRLDLRVARIKAAEPVPSAKKLLKLEVDLGAETRQIVAGIAGAYQPEALIGRKVIIVANLEPATIRGVESQGMILAAGDKEILGLSAIDADVPLGTKVR